jgi:hypothetical protein
MARSLSSALNDQIIAAQLRPFMAVEIEFDSGTSRAWSGYGTITLDGNQYYGTGTLGSISAVSESTENKAAGISISLSGIPDDLVALALSEQYQGNETRVYLGAMNHLNVPFGDPYLLFKGRIDTMQIGESPETATINLTVENRMIDLERARVRRYTPEDQKLDYPNDKGLDFVASIQDTEVTWGVNSKS